MNVRIWSHGVEQRHLNRGSLFAFDPMRIVRRQKSGDKKNGYVHPAHLEAKPHQSRQEAPVHQSISRKHQLIDLL